jgi:hypothetical protein
MFFRVSNRVSPVKLQDLRGARSTRTLAPMKVSLACGSMVLFSRFHEKVALRATFS